LHFVVNLSEFCYGDINLEKLYYYTYSACKIVPKIDEIKYLAIKISKALY